MHPLLTELHDYHREASLVVSQIAELNKTMARTQENDIRATIMDMLQKLKSSREINHHFNEELIRAALMQTDAPIHRRVEQIANDHEAFERIMGNLMALFEDQERSAEDVSGVLADYINKYFDHLEAEETIFFPMAEKWLEEEHWELVKEKWRSDEEEE